MKRTLALLIFAAYLLGQENPLAKARADYLKAVIELQGAQKRKEDLPKAIAREELSIEQAINQATEAANRAANAAAETCSKQGKMLDQTAIKEQMDFVCVAKPEEKK